MAGPGPTDKVRVPRHVVYREFSAETVVLNLDTGRYHGLDRTGGDMLETLHGAGSIGEAAQVLSERWGVERERLESDLLAFCGDLAARGLVEVDGGHRA
jgi:hypothetical protein